MTPNEKMEALYEEEFLEDLEWEEECEGYFPEDYDLEVGFDPYEGCYTYDC